MTEQWRPVVGWEGLYEVSDQGRVRSLDRTVYAGRGRTRIQRGKVLGRRDVGAYLGVHLSRDGVPRNHVVHVLVARAFLGPSPLDVLHNNGNHHDNRLSNLRYGTESQNAFDSVRHGTHFQASKTHCPARHEYTPENTYTRPHGGRECRTCRAAWSRNRNTTRSAA